MPILPLTARHQDSGCNRNFPAEISQLSDYIEFYQSLLARAHADLPPAQRLKRIQGNAPFQRFPRGAAGQKLAFRRGIVLTHGLSDSPYFMRHLADCFQQQGFRVLAILLPGHGTQPGDLLHVRWQEWQKTLQFAVAQLAQEAEQIYLGGLSAGGALSLLQSYTDTRIAGVFLFSPALQISPRAAFAKVHQLYSWAVPAAKWLSIQPDGDDYKYESFPKNAVAQMWGLTQALAKVRRQALSIPVFCAWSEQDKTVLSAATLAWFQQQPHPLSRAVCYVTDENYINTNKIRYLCCNLPAEKILSSAHTAIVLAADDTHYGLNGEYRNCVHYFAEEAEKYALCQAGQAAYLGEVTAANLQQGVLQRLMFNPYFAQLQQSLQAFIAALPV